MEIQEKEAEGKKKVKLTISIDKLPLLRKIKSEWYLFLL